jgi:hypothetical protein
MRTQKYSKYDYERGHTRSHARLQKPSAHGMRRVQCVKAYALGFRTIDPTLLG